MIFEYHLGDLLEVELMLQYVGRLGFETEVTERRSGATSDDVGGRRIPDEGNKFRSLQVTITPRANVVYSYVAGGHWKI